MKERTTIKKRVSGRVTTSIIRYLKSRGSTVERAATEDGEPKGTARLPDPKDTDLLASNKQLAVVREIAIGVDGVRTIDEALSLAAEQSRDIEGIRFVFVQKLDETGEFVITPYFSKIRNKLAAKAIKAAGFDVEKEMGESGGRSKHLKFPLAKLKVAQDYESNPRVMVVPTLAELMDSVWSKPLCDSIQKIMGLKKIVLVPLMVDGESWGSMLYYLDNEVPTDILEMIAAHCALAIKNIITLNNLESRNAELSATQEQLKQSEERYRLIFESGNDIVMLVDKKGIIVDVNKNVFPLTGYHRDDIIGNNFRSLTKMMPKKSIAIIAKNFLLRLVGVDVPSYEVEMYRSDGEIINIEITAVAVTDGTKALGTLATLRDISELKRSAQAVKENEEKFSKAFQFNPDACSITSLKDGRYLEINDSFSRITGFSREETIGATARKLNLWADEKDGETIRPILRRSRRVSGKEITFRTKSGEIRHGVYAAEIIKVSGQDCVLVNINDITDRKRMENELRDAMVKADAANQAKSDFLARMSHEIRTPIHGVKGSLDLLRDTSLGQEQRQYLNMARTSADTLLDVIEQILDFSKIEAGKMELAKADFDLRQVAEEALSNVAVLAHKKGLEVLLELSPEVPTKVNGDAVRLRQVLVNLLGNAVKFTDRGEILLSMGVERDGEKDVELHVRVKDTGIGIAKQEHGVIFNPFEQVDGSASRSYGGSGLGLAICQQLVTMMHGRIWFTSQPGEGSTFHFTITLGKQATGKGDDRSLHIPPELRGLPVLLVDDNATGRSLVRDVLQKWGCRVTEADTVEAALKELQAAGNASRPFRVVLLDETMPKTDGLTAAEQLLRHEAPQASVVMMLTSENVSGDVSRCQELGIAHYVVKPVKEPELLDSILPLLGQATGQRETGQPATPTTPGTQTSKLRILVAEDNPISQIIAQTVLEKAGHTSQLAVDGGEALRMASEGDFDLILMDVEMPVMDGLSAARAIRKSEQKTGKHVPILAMTAYAMKEDRQRCLEAGMDAYLSKPLNLDELHSIITDLSPKETTGPEVLDIDAALKLVGGDESILKRVINVFLEQDYPEQLGRLKEGIEQEDAQAVKVAAHCIKGSARSFGSATLAAKALQLEEMGRNDVLEGASTVLEELENEAKEFAEVFARYDRQEE